MKMNDEDTLRLRQFYIEAFKQYGRDDARSVQWTSGREQIQRFKVLFGVDDIAGSSLLDVGCGLGAMYKMLLQDEIEVDYTGIDVVPEYIEVARKRYPDARFEAWDIFEVEESFDYVLASGALSFKVENNLEYYQGFIKKMYEVADKAVAFNMLDRRTHVDNEIYASYDIRQIADFCSTICDRVEVVTDYLPRDFTIYLMK